MAEGRPASAGGLSPRLLGLGIAVVGTLLIAGLLALALHTGGYTAGHTDYTQLQTGDCYNLTSTGFVDRVDCSRPHHAEVTGMFRATNQRRYPGAAGFEAQAEPKCQAFATRYLASATRIDLALVWISPNGSAWDAGTRTVVCGLQSADRSPRRGSLRA